ncbi:CTP synthase [Pseudomonadota bacterium]
MPKKSASFVFISGGVLSSLGKGITTASIAFLLKNRGYKVTVVKCENYLNQDAGLINPTEHGDTFLCEDGTEADMDLGTYEKFLDQNLGFNNFVTMGQIYKSVLDKERDFFYQGEDVEAIPHVTDEILERIQAAGKLDQADIVIVELGGTAGEYQNVLYYEASRILNLKHNKTTLHIHVSYMPTPPHIGEPKTKPTQLSVKILNSQGIQPDFIVARGQDSIDDRRRERFALFCNVIPENIIDNPDLETVYELPLIFDKQKFDQKILQALNLEAKTSNLNQWKKNVKLIKSKKQSTVEIVIVGKYFNTGEYQLRDSYAALFDALDHAATHSNYNLNVRWVSSKQLETGDTSSLKGVGGIIVPIGWGSRGVEGKINAIKHARTQKIPYLGLCYGMQLAAVEFARNVCGLDSAHTKEVDPNTPHPIIHNIPFDPKYQKIKGDGTSMRLGAFDCVLQPNSLAHNIYNLHHMFLDKPKNLISERHRHRFEFNNQYREVLSEKGFVISGTSPDDFFVEMVELSQKDHPFFLATQAHPEYKSRPLKPHGIFLEFLNASNHHK